MSPDCVQVSGTGETVLMLHSSMSSKRQWKALAEELSETYQVIAVDLTGYGAADHPSDPAAYSLFSEGAHIEAALELVGVANTAQLHLVGHSFGGATALHWAYHNQERVKSLHIFEPVAFHLLDKDSEGWKEISGVVSSLDEFMATGDQEAACAHFIDYWSGKGAFASFPPHIQSAMVAQVPKVILDFQALIGATLTLEDYAKLDFPMTLIKGTQSPCSSQTIALSLKDTLKDVNFHLVECGHMGPITHAAQVNEVFVKAFTSL